MRKISLIIFISVLGLFNLTTHAADNYDLQNHAGTCLPEMKLDTALIDPIDSWPWGSELPFPWLSMQGLWSAKINGCTTYFSFVYIKPRKDGERTMRIQQVDPISCRVLASGYGYESENVVEAIMRKPAPQFGAYELAVQVFKSSDLMLRSDTKSADTQDVTVISINPVGHPSQQSSYQLYRINTKPGLVCR